MTPLESLVPSVADALAARGYDALTPVQEAVLDPELASEDLVVSAQTGSGKTVAFGLAMAVTLLGEDGQFGNADAPVALAIAPTRELALQVKRELDWLYAKAGARVESCVGGMDMRDERRALARGAHIVVGTPGRLVDHIKRGSLQMDALQAIVLDEADEMLDLGFRDELEFILGGSPQDRRTLMFSATMPRAIAALAKKYQRDAVRVNTVSEASQHLDIEYRALVTGGHDSENAIFNVLRYYDAKNAIVFCQTRAAVNHLTSRFSNRGFSVVALSGELSQKERTHALQAMRDGRAQVCVATDVAARGIDLPELELVIHADLPKNREGLLHRSGRTGRAGRKGTSVLIVPFKARRRTERLLENAKIEAEWADPPTADDVTARDNERLLADPALSDPIEDAQRDLVRDLLAAHSAEQIASAFVRLHRQGKSAPEDISPAPAFEPGARDTKRRDRKDKPRDDFDNGVWISLSVGRSKSAEARWLLPMLCKAGGLDKKDIGAIRVQENETHVEIAPGSVESLFAAIGDDGKLEKAVYAKRMDGAPKPPSRDGKRTYGNGPKPRGKPKHKPRARPDSDAPADAPKYAKGAKSYGGEEPAETEQKPSAFKSKDYATGDAKPKRPRKPKPSAFTTKSSAPGGKQRASKTPPTNRNKRKWSPNK